MRSYRQVTRNQRSRSVRGLGEVAQVGACEPRRSARDAAPDRQADELEPGLKKNPDLEGSQAGTFRLYLICKAANY